MEKLIDLLNEYEEEKTDLTFKPHFWDAYGGHLSFLEYNSKYSDLLCISKRYEFIQRLVDNDKIDLSKVEKIGHEETVSMYDGQYRKIVEYSDYENLLMLLSIQDNPINFLISLLK